MTQHPSDGIGQRLAKYRKLSGMSAQALSDVTGGDLSRSVIANIESGRKIDVTIDQMLTLSWALDIPPMALALPLETPFAEVTVAPNSPTMSTLSTVRVLDLIDWFRGKSFPVEPFLAGYPRVGNTLALAVLSGLDRLADRMERYRRVSAEAEPDQQYLEHLREQIRTTRENLSSLGVALNEE